MIKTQGRFKKAIWLLMASFIPSIFYTIGVILNIEAEFASGKFLSLILDTTTTFLTLLALIVLNKLVGGMNGQKEYKEKNKKPKKNSIGKRFVKKRGEKRDYFRILRRINRESIIHQEEKPIRINKKNLKKKYSKKIRGNIEEKYLDLTGKKPKFRA